MTANYLFYLVWSLLINNRLIISLTELSLNGIMIINDQLIKYNHLEVYMYITKDLKRGYNSYLSLDENNGEGSYMDVGLLILEEGDT